MHELSLDLLVERFQPRSTPQRRPPLQEVMLGGLWENALTSLAMLPTEARKDPRYVLRLCQVVA